MFETVENWALHAFADGELEGEEKQAVEALLARDEAARKALAAYTQQKQQLHRAYDSILDEPVPSAILAAAKGHRLQYRRWPLGLVAGLALLGLGTVLGLGAAQHLEGVQQASLANRAAVAYQTFAPEVRHPVEVASDDQDHLKAWLSKRIGTEIKIPDLQDAGYTLLGGRLLAEADHPAGQLMYEDANKKRLTIYLTQNTGAKEQSLALADSPGLVTCYWRDGALAMAISADMPHDAMMTLAKDIYEQMDAKG
ncbi:MAG: anti-sigma factor [Aestuariivirga sp.]